MCCREQECSSLRGSAAQERRKIVGWKSGHISIAGCKNLVLHAGGALMSAVHP